MATRLEGLQAVINANANGRVNAPRANVASKNSHVVEFIARILYVCFVIGLAGVSIYGGIKSYDLTKNKNKGIKVGGVFGIIGSVLGFIIALFMGMSMAAIIRG